MSTFFLKLRLMFRAKRRIFIALEKDNLTKFKAFLKVGANPDMKDSEGEPLLLKAVRKKDERFLVRLLERGANPNIADNNGITPLMVAAVHNRENMVDLLLRSGASVFSETDRGLTPLFYAVRGRAHRVFESFMRQGALINAQDSRGDTPLFFAVERRSPLMVEACLMYKSCKRNHQNFAGETALMKAAEMGWVCGMLVTPENINMQDKNGETALMKAFKGRHFSSFEWLLESGADMHIKNNVGLSTLDMVRMYNAYDFLGALHQNSGFNRVVSSKSLPVQRKEERVRS